MPCTIASTSLPLYSSSKFNHKVEKGLYSQLCDTTNRAHEHVQLACLSSSRVSLANRSFYRRNSRTNLSVFLSHRSVLIQGFIPSKKQGKTLICKSRLSIPDALAADCYLVDKMNSYRRSKAKRRYR